MISDIVFYLLKKGAHKEPKKITTGEIAEHIGLSQQTASRKLIQLEKNGEIRRIGGKILLTERAISGIRRMMKDILDSLEGTAIIFSGTVVKGFGEGAYYLSQREYVAQFRKKFGFKPFPGTLNVNIDPSDIEKRVLLREQPPIEIPGFKKEKRTFGKIAGYRCVINGIPCALIFPERSHHGLRVLEIISEFNLKKKLPVSDGGPIQVEIVGSQP